MVFDLLVYAVDCVVSCIIYSSILLMRCVLLIVLSCLTYSCMLLTVLSCLTYSRMLLTVLCPV